MLNRASAALVAAFALSLSAPAFAAGEILITQAKAIAGNVTPGDAPGFPVTLSRPGAYQLASNLRPPASKTAIRITHHRVTIDLNGFQLNGAGGATIAYMEQISRAPPSATAPSPASPPTASMAKESTGSSRTCAWPRTGGTASSLAASTPP